MPEFQFDGEVMQRKPNSPDDREAVRIRRKVCSIQKDTPPDDGEVMSLRRKTSIQKDIEAPPPALPSCCPRSHKIVRIPSNRMMMSMHDDDDSVETFYHSSHDQRDLPPDLPTAHHRRQGSYNENAVVTFVRKPHSDPANDDDDSIPPPTQKAHDGEQPSLSRISEGSFTVDMSASFNSVGVPARESGPHVPSKASHSAYRARSILKRLLRHKAIKIMQIFLAVYVAVLTFAPIGSPGGLQDKDTGLIVDSSQERTDKGMIMVNGIERATIAETKFQVVAIGIARTSAFFMYPALVFVYISKLRATTSYLARTPLAMFICGDFHELHLYCGWTILICSLVHSIFHLIRWAQQGNLELLFRHFSGISGFLIFASLILICLPMIIWKEKIKYEIRKSLHYFFLLFAFALCFHTSPKSVPNGGFTAYVFGTILVWYFLDASYCTFFMSEKIETTKFDVLPNGVQMTMTVSKFFQKNGGQGGYCYVCFPWVDKTQWHAFSLFENPVNPQERQIFLQKGGDWTGKVHEILQRDTVRPAWIQGPFPSPYDSAEEYDNQILVASGIGITPALSVIRAHKDSRRINLIWAVRDRHLLSFFLRHLYLDNSGWNLLFYTGSEPLEKSEIEIFTNTNVCIIHGRRPELPQIIVNIVYGIESGRGLPERYIPDIKREASTKMAEMVGDDECVSTQKLQDISNWAGQNGFQMQEFESSAISQPRSEFDSRSQHRRRKSDVIMKHLDIGFKPWESHPEAHRFVKQLSKDNIAMPTWGMLYCGGAKAVENDLRKVSDRYQIDLHVESFGW